MILDVRFTYVAQVKRHKRRVEEEFLYDHRCPLELREVDPAAAPVAVRYQKRMDYGEPDLMEDLRWFDGALWAPYRVSTYSGEASVHRDADWYAAQSAAPESSYGASSGQRHYNRTSRGALEHDKEVREVVDDRERREKVEDAREALDRLMVVRGMVWTKVVEPKLVVTPVHHGPGLSYYARVESKPRERAADVFRLDHGHRVREAKGMRAGVEVALPEVEVLIEGVLKHRADERYMLDEGAHLLGRMKSFVAEGSRDYFGAYADLREAQAAYEAMADEDGVDFGPYARILEACAAVHVARPGAGEGSMRDVDRAVARWRSFDEADEVQAMFGL